MDKEIVKQYFDGNYLQFYQKYIPTEIKRNGKGHMAVCPFHDDKNPSFLINEDGTFKCFSSSCGKKGDIFNFYQYLRNSTFLQSLEGIAGDFSIAGTYVTQKRPPDKPVNIEPWEDVPIDAYEGRDIDLEINKPEPEAPQSCNPEDCPVQKKDFDALFEQLKKNPLPDKANEFLRSRGLDLTEYIESQGLVGYNPAKRAITFPMMDLETGEIIGLQNIHHERKKGNRRYLMESGSNMSNGIMVLPGDGPTIIVESVFDGLSAKFADDDHNVIVAFSSGCKAKLERMKKLDKAGKLQVSLKDPIFFFDNDKAGRTVTEEAGKLFPQGRYVCWDGDSEGMDVNDVLKEKGVESIVDLVSMAKKFKPTLKDAVLPISVFRKLNIPKRKTLLNPWLKESSMNMVSGWRGCGKSWFAMSVVNAVAGGKSFGSWECSDPAKCLYLEGEMAVEEDIARIGLMDMENENIEYYASGYANSLGLPAPNLNDETWRTEMMELLSDHKIKLFVVDNLVSLTPGMDENTTMDWSPINQWLINLRHKGIATMLVHHLNKDGRQRGTSSREDNLDMSIVLKQPQDYAPDDGARFITHFSKHRIPGKDLNLIADTEFKLIEIEGGLYGWEVKDVKRDQMRVVLEGLSQGLSQSKIVECNDISKGQVSKLRQKAIKKGYLTENDKLTSHGEIIISDGIF